MRFLFVFLCFVLSLFLIDAVIQGPDPQRVPQAPNYLKDQAMGVGKTLGFGSMGPGSGSQSTAEDGDSSTSSRRKRKAVYENKLYGWFKERRKREARKQQSKEERKALKLIQKEAQKEERLARSQRAAFGHFPDVPRQPFKKGPAVKPGFGRRKRSAVKARQPH